MKTHTQDFKDKIKELGRELDSKITYELNSETIELGNEELNSITPHYEGALLKSIMKQLDIDSNVDIPIGTEVNYQLGIKIENDYEYLDYGNYIVFSSEKQEDTNSYKIIAYDKMLYSMKPYEALTDTLGDTITYPITLRDYLIALARRLNLTFKNASDTFVNYDKEIKSERYLTEDGESLNYTYRDVLDELSQATASSICISDDDELEVRYPTLAGDTTNVSGTSIYITDAKKQGILYEGVNNITQINNDLPFIMELEYVSQSDFETIDEEYLKDVNVKFGEKFGPVNALSLARSADSDIIDRTDDESIQENGLCEIRISDNQILNDDDRDLFIDGIFNQLKGLEYYVNDYSSTGICYYDFLDRYNVKVDDKFYSCLMLNDEIEVSQGLIENIHAEAMEQQETDYTKSSKTDKLERRTGIIVDKQNGTIDLFVERVNTLEDDYDDLDGKVADLGTRMSIAESGVQIAVSVQQQINDGVELVKTGIVTIDESGIDVGNTSSKVHTKMRNNEFSVGSENSDEKFCFIGYDEVNNISKGEIDNLYVRHWLSAGVHRTEAFTVNGETRTGVFYEGSRQ